MNNLTQSIYFLNKELEIIKTRIEICKKKNRSSVKLILIKEQLEQAIRLLKSINDII